MFIGTDALIGMGILLVCILLAVVIMGFAIFSEMYAMRKLFLKFLKLYTMIHSKNHDQNNLKP